MTGYEHTHRNMDGNASAFATKPDPSKNDSYRAMQIAHLSGALDDCIDYR